MGKLRDKLQKQSKTKYKKETEDCLKIYNKLLELNGDGSVWSSQWNVLTTVADYIGTYPNSIMVYKPSAIGYIFLKGLS